MMLEYAFYALVAVVAAYAWLDWRRGLLACVVLDGLRDPVRKLMPHYPVGVTLSVTLVWIVIFLAALTQDRAAIQAMLRRYPKLLTAFWFLLAALVPGAIVSLVSYPAGVVLATVGSISYLFPVVGLAAGFAHLRQPFAWRGLLESYCFTNALLLPSALAESFKLPVPGLGGMGIRWIRQQSGGLEISLISGWYRSPDLLGLHAAHVMMFGSVLALYSGRRLRWLWLPLVALAAICLLLSGRRKMIIMPAAFLMVWAIGAVRRGAGATAKLLLAGLVVAGAAYKFWPSSASDDYLTYTARTWDEALDRLTGHSLGGFVETLSQAGLLGWGLGTATQGNHLLATHTARTWQEDGISRFAAEFGLLGSLLIAVAGIYFAYSLRQALLVPARRSTAALWQITWLGVAAANAASFAVSHQAYSGDPSSIALASLFVGYVFATPLAISRAAAPTSLAAVHGTPVGAT